MRATRRLPVEGVEAAIVALAAAASLLVACGTWKIGIGLSPDSNQFVSAARNLVAGNGDFAGSNLPAFSPPLFMVVLAAPGFFGVGPIIAAGVLNPVILGLICLVAGLWFYRLTGAPLLTVLSLIYAVRFIEEDAPRRLYLAAALAALACLTRYAGVALVASTLLVLLVAGRRTLPRTVARMTAYAAIAAVPLGLWLLRNWLLTDTLTGWRHPAEFSVVYNLVRTAGTLGVWTVPFARGTAEGAVLESELGRGSAVAVLAFAGMALAALASVARSRRGLRDKLARLGVTSPPFGVLTCYAGVYMAFLVAVASTVRINAIGDRLLAPVLVPLVLAAALVAAGLAKELAQPPSRRPGRWPAWACAAYVAAYVACYALESKRWLDHLHASQFN